MRPHGAAWIAGGLGLAVGLPAVVDALLSVGSVNFGNALWEFGFVAQVTMSAPAVLLGLALIALGADLSGSRRLGLVRTLGGAAVFVVAALLLVLFLLSTPVSFRAVAVDADARLAMLKVAAKSVGMCLAVMAGSGVMMWKPTVADKRRVTE